MTRSTLLRIYVVLTVLVGTVGLTLIPAEGVERHLGAFATIAALATLFSLLPVKLKALRIEFTATDPVAVAALGAIGGWGLITVYLITVLVSWISNRVRGNKGSIGRLLFNLGAHVWCAVLAATIFERLGGHPGAPIAHTIGPLAISAAALFLCNTLSVTVAVALESGRPIHKIWRESFVWTIASFLSGTSIAACLLLLLQTVGTWGLALAIPPCWMIVVFYRTHRERLQEQQDRIEEVEALNSELEHKVQNRTRELQTANSSLTDVNRKLESANRAKSEFLANMTHELRTPLNSVIGFSDLIVDPSSGNLNARQQDLIDDIRNSGEHLLSLINDILDLAKLDAHKMELHPCDFDVRSLVEKSMAIVRPLVHKKNINMTASFAEEVEFGFLDPKMLRGAMVNLLSNAVKFTSDGGTITVSVQEDGPLGLKITVSDTGIGISRDDQQKIFDEFYQADGSNTRGFQGTGLGLALVMRTTQMHGGKIEVESEPGEGSSFTLHYPECRTPVSVGNPVDVKVYPARRRSLVPSDTAVFVVEADRLTRSLIRNVLRTRGYRVTDYPSTDALHDAFDRECPDLLLLDLDAETGWKNCARKIVGDPRCRGVQLVGLSSDPAGCRGDLEHAGGIGVIEKPVRILTFADQLARLAGPEENVA